MKKLLLHTQAVILIFNPFECTGNLCAVYAVRFFRHYNSVKRCTILCADRLVFYCKCRRCLCHSYSDFCLELEVKADAEPTVTGTVAYGAQNLSAVTFATQGTVVIKVFSKGFASSSSVSFSSLIHLNVPETFAATIDEATGVVTVVKVGTSVITAKVAAVAEQYEGATATYTLAVTARPITITADDKTMKAGEAEPAYTYTLGGTLAYEDRIGSVAMTVEGDKTEGTSCCRACAADCNCVTVNGNIQPIRAVYLFHCIPRCTSGGSGGGGGGGSSSVTVPVSGDDKSVEVSAKVSGSTATIDKIEGLNKVLDGDVDTGVVEIDLTALKKDIDTVKLPAAALEDIAKAAADADNDVEGLAVKLDSGTVEFDADALEAIPPGPPEEEPPPLEGFVTAPTATATVLTSGVSAVLSVIFTVSVAAA